MKGLFWNGPGVLTLSKEVAKVLGKVELLPGDELPKDIIESDEALKKLMSKQKVVTNLVAAATSIDMGKLLEEAKGRIAELETQLAEQGADDLKTRIAELEEQLAEARSQVTTSEGTIAQLNQMIADLTAPAGDAPATGDTPAAGPAGPAPAGKGGKK